MAAIMNAIAVLNFIATRPGPHVIKIGICRSQPARTTAPVANTNKLSSSDSFLDVLGFMLPDCRKIFQGRKFTLPLGVGERYWTLSAHLHSTLNVER